MPLRAYINGEEKISVLCTDEEWTTLKEKVKSDAIDIQLACCRQPGFLRTSTKGLKHFVHTKSDNTCDWKPETPEHLKTKVEVVDACIKSGWTATPEYSENDWRADVLTTKGSGRIAFEIQWSAQTAETTQFRQARYNESKVRGCWFFRTIPKEYREWKDTYKAIKDIPFFKISKGANDQMLVHFNKKELPIGDFVNKLLTKKIKFCENYRVNPNQQIEFLFFEMSCWKCGKQQHMYTVDERVQSCCNNEIYLMGSFWDEEDLDKHPAIINAAKKIVLENPELKLGPIKKRYSKTIHESYLSFGCVNCDALFGDFPLSSEKLEAKSYGNGQKFNVNVDLGIAKQEGAHWCYSADGEFCE